MALKTRVRFAPSPTGRLHIGGARTAIFNWAFARATRGDFILRIEDTDPERSTEENVRVIVDALKWLGLDWDEGPEIGGSAGPYFQMQRRETYQDALEQLKAKGAVYPCFCSKEELDNKRKSIESQGGTYEGYDRTCRDLTPDEVQKRIDAGEACVWRLKVPLDHGPITFSDAVYGAMSFPVDAMDDLILMRADGSPTYNFACVCDDVNMGITHVIRGDDHLSNTPRQVLIYEALGKPVPEFAHLCMILGSDGKKLSKRHGATSVEEYRDRGYVPDAMVNFLALLGWSLDGETTLISREQLCSEFGLDRVTRKDAIFDETKLDWMNGVYIREMGAKKWVEAAAPWLLETFVKGQSVSAGVHIVPSGGDSAQDAASQGAQDVQGTQNVQDAQGVQDVQGTQNAQDAQGTQNAQDAQVFVEERSTWLEKLYPLVAERLAHFDEIPDKLAYLFWGDSCLLDEKSVSKVLLKEGARAQEALKACRDVLADTSLAWEAAILEEHCRSLAEPLDMKLRNLLQPLRVAVCGNMVSPPLFESIELMDRAAVIARIDGVAATVYGS